MKTLIPIVFFLFTLLGYGQDAPYITVRRTAKLMGSSFEITLVTDNEQIGYINLDEATAEIQRIEKLISSWDETSETSQINKNAGIRPVKVSHELFGLIERAKQISELTNGAFDITSATLYDYWKFDGSMERMPTTLELEKALTKVDYRKIVLNKSQSTVFLKEKNMKINFNAIGKGYAVDKAKELLVSKGVVSGVINASGDLTTWGTKASGDRWLLGIANPKSENKLFSWVPIVESSVATTVVDERYITIGNKKYGHIIDPRTGYPITGVKSVHIFTKTAELADALATAISVLGRDSGLALVNQLRGTEVIVVDDNNKMYKTGGVLYSSK